MPTLRNLFIILLLSACALGQSSRSGGVYLASAYANWQLNTTSQVPTAGTFPVTLSGGSATTSDGRQFIPIRAGFPIAIGNLANFEVITPTSTANCSLRPNPFAPCRITATFTFSHSLGNIVRSSSFGLQEAIADATANGGGVVMVDASWGGTTAIFTAAAGNTSVALQDNRSGAPTTYTWNGSAYAATGGGGGGTIGGSGIVNFLPKMVTNTTTLGASLFSDDATNGAYGGSSFYVGTPDPSCGAATGCIGIPEGGTSGTPTTGHFYMRPDSGTHALMLSKNGSAEQFAVSATNSGAVGQPCLSNGTGDGACAYADPLVSFAPINLFNNVAATGTVTSSNARLSALGMQGTLWVTLANITGSPSGCSVQLFPADSLGNSVAGTVTSVSSVVNGTQTFSVSSGASAANAAQVAAKWACSGAYPTLSSTISVDFVPALPTTNQNPTANPLPTDVRKLSGVTIPGSSGAMPIIGNDGVSLLDVGSGTNRSWTGHMVPGSVTNSTGPDQWRGCDQKKVLNAFSTSGTTQEVAISGSTQIFVCGWTANSASTTAVTVKLVYGTGSNCGTGTADFSEQWTLQAVTSNSPVGFVDWAPPNVVDATPAGQALCVNLSAAQAVNLKIYYAQY